MDLNANQNSKMIIYQLLNKVTNKSYIGKTKYNWGTRKKTYDRDLINANRQCLIIRSLRKHGWENFNVNILESNVQSVDILNQREKEYIKSYETMDPNKGYNMTPGGDGGCSITAAATNKIRMLKYVADGTFILQRPNIKQKAITAATLKNKQLILEGRSNLQTPEHKAKAKAAHLKVWQKPICITIESNGGGVHSYHYKSKKDAIADGFALSLIRQLVLNGRVDIKQHALEKFKYRKGDTITLEYT